MQPTLNEVKGTKFAHEIPTCLYLCPLIPMIVFFLFVASSEFAARAQRATVQHFAFAFFPLTNTQTHKKEKRNDNQVTLNYIY